MILTKRLRFSGKTVKHFLSLPSSLGLLSRKNVFMTWLDLWRQTATIAVCFSHEQLSIALCFSNFLTSFSTVICFFFSNFFQLMSHLKLSIFLSVHNLKALSFSFLLWCHCHSFCLLPPDQFESICFSPWLPIPILHLHVSSRWVELQFWALECGHWWRRATTWVSWLPALLLCLHISLSWPAAWW